MAVFHLREWINDLPPARRAWTVVLGVAALLVVSVIDYVTGWELDAQVLYLVPVVAVAWAVGLTPGVSLAVLAALLTLGVEMLDGKPYSHPAMPLWNALAVAACLGVIAWSLSALKVAWRHEHEAARTDALTGAMNRKGFLEVLELELQRARRYGHELSFAYVDCDEFKQVNDRHGHEAGDRLLRAIAHAVRATLRQPDSVARLGGDEFGILLPETGERDALRLAERLVTVIEAHPESLRLGASVSMGVVTFLRPPPTVDDVIREADLLMYDVKRAGRRGVRHAVAGAPAGEA